MSEFRGWIFPDLLTRTGCTSNKIYISCFFFDNWGNIEQAAGTLNSFHFQLLSYQCCITFNCGRFFAKLIPIFLL